MQACRQKAHPRGGANGKRAKVVRDAGADAVALWDVACTMEDMCRLVDAMDAYIDSDGSQEYACDACAGQARACAACGVRGIQHLEREVQEAHAALGTRAAADAAANHEHFPSPPAAVVSGGLCVVSAGSHGWRVVTMVMV